MPYQIVQAVDDVLFFGGHNFFVLMKDGVAISQINGYSTDANGVPQVASLGGMLTVRSDYQQPFTSSTPQAVLVTGDYLKVTSLWNSGLECAAAVNALQLNYQVLDIGGKNSNAAFSTVA